MIFETLFALAVIAAIGYFGYKYYKKAKASGSGTGLGGGNGRDGADKF
jgi:hypothetical protein